MRMFHVAGIAVVGILAAVPAIRLALKDLEEVYVFQRREVVTAIGLVPYHVYDFLSNVSRSISGRAILSEDDVAAGRALPW